MKKIDNKLQRIISGFIFLIDIWIPTSCYSIIIKLFSNNIFLQKIDIICTVVIFLLSFSLFPNMFVYFFGKTVGMYIFGVDIYDENELIQNQKGKKGNFLYWFFTNGSLLKYLNLQKKKIFLYWNNESYKIRILKISCIIIYIIWQISLCKKY